MGAELSIQVNAVSKKEWTELLTQFSDASLYQTWSYGESRWGRSNLCHIIVKRREQIMGIAQIAIRKLPFLQRGIAYVPWGPLWKRKPGCPESNDFVSVLDALVNEFCMRRRLFLRIAPNIIRDEDDDIEALLARAGFQQCAEMKPYRTMILDLKPSIETLRKGLNPKWRNKLNQAEKNDLKVHEGTSDSLFSAYLALQKQLVERKQYDAGVNYDQFKEIQTDLGEALRMRVFLCERQGVPIAASVCSAIGDTGIYLLGATGDEGLNLKGSYLLQWRVIDWLKREGFRYYDLGGINPTSNPGVFHFKAGLSGKEAFHLGQYECCHDRISAVLVRVGEQLRKVVKRTIKI